LGSLLQVDVLFFEYRRPEFFDPPRGSQAGRGSSLRDKRRLDEYRCPFPARPQSLDKSLLWGLPSANVRATAVLREQPAPGGVEERAWDPREKS
jgi:hypothetical protein